MIYQLLKILVYIAVKLYFRKIYLNGQSKVPPKGPLLLVANHPNSFLDAVILAVLLKRSLYFLARSDVFNRPWKRWILAQLHMIPIYRITEGKENLSKNEATFEHCKELFEAGKMVLIFPEGLSIPEKRLRKLKKGAAKIAFQSEAMNEFKLHIQVLCVGINYTHPTKARQNLLIQFDAPFALTSFQEAYQMQPAQAIHHLNQSIEEGLKRNMLIIEQPSEEPLAESLLKLLHNSQNFSAEKVLVAEQSILQKIKVLPKDTLEKIEAYFYQLDFHGIADKALQQKTSLFAQILLYIFFPFYFIGKDLHFIPHHYAAQIADKKTRNTQFYLSVHFALHFVLILIYYKLFFIVMWIFLSWKVACLSTSILALLGLFSLFFERHWQAHRESVYLSKLAKEEPSLISHLKETRAMILKEVMDTCFFS